MVKEVMGVYSLYHYGVKGMHWGERRYQNKDGSLTNAGRNHYGYKTSISSLSGSSDLVGYATSGGVKNPYRSAAKEAVRQNGSKAAAIEAVKSETKQSKTENTSTAIGRVVGRTIGAPVGLAGGVGLAMAMGVPVAVSATVAPALVLPVALAVGARNANDLRRAREANAVLEMNQNRLVSEIYRK